MSLMYDRMSARGFTPSSEHEPHVFDIQNVADYYHQHMFTEDRAWMFSDVPNIAPPFDRFWMEFRVRKFYYEKAPALFDVRWGVGFDATDLRCQETKDADAIRQAFRRLMKNKDVDYWGDGSSPDPDLFEKDRATAVWIYLVGYTRGEIEPSEIIRRAKYLYGLTSARWCLLSTVFCETMGRIGTVSFNMCFVTSEGTVYPGSEVRIRSRLVGALTSLDQLSPTEQTQQVFGTVVMPALLAVSFLHCKNVVTVTQNPPAKLSKASEKRHGKPLVRYHILDIEPMKKVLKHEGQSEKTGLKRALHICRGHFAHYTEEKPLFGRTVGRFWIPSHVRGSLEEGIVDKDYRIKEPKQ